jgi:hypothetical protein
MGIDPLSLTALPIDMLFNDTQISVGTAFLWDEGDAVFLVTNLHNVTGKDFFTGKHLSPTAAEPNRVRVWMNQRNSALGKAPLDVALFGCDGCPLWRTSENPYGSSDIALIDIDLPSWVQPAFVATNLVDLEVRVGADAFILGYPFGRGSAGLPIWKRASIASEPDSLHPDQLFIFVDTASRPGMSGSPVFLRTWGPVLGADGKLTAYAGGASRFIGVYAGRMASSDPLDAQLGLVWPSGFVHGIAKQALESRNSPEPTGGR